MKKQLVTLLESDSIKVNVLLTLGDGQFHTPSELAARFRTSSRTIARNVAFLSLMGMVTVETRVTKQRVTYFRITQRGADILNLIRSSTSREG